MSRLTLGVIGISKKQDEQRVPIHPEHLPRLTEDYRKQLIFEEGYGAPFDISDAEIAWQTGGVAPRDALLAELRNVIIAKPVLSDLEQLREGGVPWESASRSISAAHVEYLPTVVDGPLAWEEDETIRRALNIEAGVIV
jgi:hypothetical protein